MSIKNYEISLRIKYSVHYSIYDIYFCEWAAMSNKRKNKAYDVRDSMISNPYIV